MAQKIQTLFIDDIDGGVAEGTVRFSLDGNEFEIDLSSKHSDQLRGVLANYVAHARKVSGASRRTPRGRRSNVGALDTAKVRGWAKAEGYDIKDRGRVPADVMAKYREVNGQ